MFVFLIDMINQFDFFANHRRLPLKWKVKRTVMQKVNFLETPKMMVQYLIGQIKLKTGESCQYQQRILRLIASDEGKDLMHSTTNDDLLLVLYGNQLQTKWTASQSFTKFVTFYVKNMFGNLAYKVLCMYCCLKFVC